MNPRAALALAALALTATAPGAGAAGECVATGEITYTAANVRVVSSVDFAPCRLVGKLGNVRMTVELRRTDLVTGQTTVTRGRPVRCAVRAPSCTIRLTVPHAPTEAARYEATATYDGDGGRHLASGYVWVSTKCWSVAATYTSCWVPV